MIWRSTLTHELAHHVDAWEDRPTEHLAEAVVAHVAEDRSSHSDIIEISDEAFGLVHRWATETA